MCVTFPASLVRGWDSLKGATVVTAASAVMAGLKESDLASARGGRWAPESAGMAGQLDWEGPPCRNTEPAAVSAVQGPARPADVAATKRGKSTMIRKLPNYWANFPELDAGGIAPCALLLSRT